MSSILERFEIWHKGAPLWKRAPATIGIIVGGILAVLLIAFLIIMLAIGLWQLLGPWSMLLYIAIPAGIGIEALISQDRKEEAAPLAKRKTREW